MSLSYCIYRRVSVVAAVGMAPNWHQGFNNYNDDSGRSDILGGTPAQCCVYVLEIKTKVTTYQSQYDLLKNVNIHYSDIIMGSMASQTSVKVIKDVPPFKHPFFTPGTPSRWVFKSQTYSCWLFFFHLEQLSLGEICEFFHIWPLSLGSLLWKGNNSPRGYSGWGENSPRGPLTTTHFGAPWDQLTTKIRLIFLINAWRNR